jgi:hypothetical protein
MIVPFYGYLNNRIKRLLNINKLAKRRRLNFLSQDEVGANIIALDLPKRKLLYVKKAPDTSSCLIIDLNNLEKCTIKKEYNSINAGELKSKKLHHFLKSIFLNLVFKNGSRTVSLPLFDVRKDEQDNIEKLEAQAKKWKSIVSKLLPNQIRERA